MSAEPVVATRSLEAVLPSGDGVGPVDLSLGPGERMLVLGPSGSGKSTLLRLLHGAIPHAFRATVSGCAKLAGHDVASATVAGLAAHAGVVAQDPVSGVCLATVEQEVAFPLENLAMPRSAIEPAVDVALARAGAAHLRHRGTGELSGGELQRVALAAAIAAEPAALLLDEPTAMLDAAGIDAVRAALETARAATGAASVLVEHRLDELAGDAGAAALPERWLVLGPTGRVRWQGHREALDVETLRELIALGCWLPADLELAALAGDRDLELEAALAAVLGEASRASGRSGELAVGPDPSASCDPGAGAVASVTTPAARSDPPGTGRVHPLGALTAEPLLRAEGVAVGHRRAPVLEGFDLALRPGEVVALVGANGTGKTTLLTALAGLTRPLAGSVRGERAGMVFQHPEHQFAASTVRAELAVGLPASLQDRIGPMLERFGLERLAERSPHRLSGGQQRRLSLAAMLVHERRVLLADEPTFGLDRHAASAALGALREAADSGGAVLLACHDLRAVAAHADRVLVLADGRLLADTTPLALLRDERMHVAAGLRPSRLLRALAARAVDDAALRDELARLEAAAQALRGEVDLGGAPPAVDRGISSAHPFATASTGAPA
ncbi:ABC transporter ATP-binding protein [Arenivirga flava]|uniref:ABC transporter ATP-binding protein n=1 Tax=Arenivirga flava TaxID=1930060 RepID=UPI0024E1621A|nr:ABC transporter ATP-binding protein [Arenivirga flava]